MYTDWQENVRDSLKIFHILFVRLVTLHFAQVTVNQFPISQFTRQFNNKEIIKEVLNIFYIYLSLVFQQGLTCCTANGRLLQRLFFMFWRSKEKNKTKSSEQKKSYICSHANY